MFDSFTKETLYEYPSFKVALFSILLAFVLSGGIAYTYYLTNRKLAPSRNFLQAMVLSSIVSCMVIMAVGNNVAAGFGILGAIAIVRFRVNIENPRNIIFIFATLSVGVATGVYGYSIALAGTVAFCIIVGLLYYSQFGATILVREYTFNATLVKDIDLNSLESDLSQYCENFQLLSMTSNKTGNRFRFVIILKKAMTKEAFFQEMQARDELSNIRLERADNLNKI